MKQYESLSTITIHEARVKLKKKKARIKNCKIILFGLDVLYFDCFVGEYVF